MPRGGRRVGAGRKPKAKKAVVLGFDGARRSDPPAVPAAAAPSVDQFQDLATPPGDLPADQQAFWRLYAPYALEQRTLIPATVIGFRELCELFAIKHTIAAQIQGYKLGAASKSAAAPLRTYMKLAQRLDALLARFKLTSFGKAADTGGPAKPAVANPWAQVAGK